MADIFADEILKVFLLMQSNFNVHNGLVRSKTALVQMMAYFWWGRQAIIWANGGIYYWCVSDILDRNELKYAIEFHLMLKPFITKTPASCHFSNKAQYRVTC